MSEFQRRHIGPSVSEAREMLRLLGLESVDQLVAATVPQAIRARRPLAFETTSAEGMSEEAVLRDLRALSSKNKVRRSMIGMGYSDTLTPSVILRGILENPGWYTQYTPYQAEIAQGRLEALLNFQTMVSDLTGLEIANASLLDEATAAAEAMAMSFALKNRDLSRAFFVSESCHPQTIEVLRTRAEPLGIRLLVGDHRKLKFDSPIFGAIVQYPGTRGEVSDYTDFIKAAHAHGAMVTVAADILALTVLKPPGEMGADIAVGSTQRFGVPMGFGGPHAAFMATRDAYKRQMPGRIVGLSKDSEGRSAIRLALQTREQHIRRDKATSNICTAQVLLAVVASMYAVYHGPEGLREIAERTHELAGALAFGLRKLGYAVSAAPFFDTLMVSVDEPRATELYGAAQARGYNLRLAGNGEIGISLDETTRSEDLDVLFEVFAQGESYGFTASQAIAAHRKSWGTLERKSAYLTHPTFHAYRSETEMMRYMARLQSKDLSLTTSMIPLGSCTMKLNAAAEMAAVTWPEFGNIHPFAPREQTEGYLLLISRLEKMLAEITGFAGISLQPNAGSQGEYAGLLVIRKFHQTRGEGHRDVCLIPQSAHGTNPASAAMAGFRVVVVKTDESGNVDLADLRARAEEHAKALAALMVTYPSTHGVFEEGIQEICEIVHKNGGQVYMDGANMNAQVGLCRPGDFGPDVCHLNLHKTFSIPHGGGGPGVGPIGVAKHLVAYLPTHPVVATGARETGVSAVSAAPWGSPSILPIPYAYIAMMGGNGLKAATEMAILNANYVAKRLEPHFPVLYRGKKGFVAHECILDLRGLKTTTGVEVEDVAKRLMDYGFHAPTISFPVAGTLMIEPTESESKRELDRFCDAMIAIRQEIAEIERGTADRTNNVLKNAPHTAAAVTREDWGRPYSREKAVFPLPYVKEHKFWPAVARVDNVYGDRNLVCACQPIE